MLETISAWAAIGVDHILLDPVAPGGIDGTLREGAGHAHPASVSTEQMAAVLRGIRVREPLTRLPLYDDLSIPHRHRAFNEEAVMFWAP